MWPYVSCLYHSIWKGNLLLCSPLDYHRYVHLTSDWRQRLLLEQCLQWCHSVFLTGCIHKNNRQLCAGSLVFAPQVKDRELIETTKICHAKLRSLCRIEEIYMRAYFLPTLEETRNRKMEALRTGSYLHCSNEIRCRTGFLEENTQDHHDIMEIGITRGA